MEGSVILCGFLLAASSIGMSWSDPLVQTYVMHRRDGTLVVTIAQHAKASGEFMSARLKRMEPDGTVDHLGTIAFEGDWMPEGFVASDLLARPGTYREEMVAILCRCTEIADARRHIAARS